MSKHLFVVAQPKQNKDIIIIIIIMKGSKYCVTKIIFSIKYPRLNTNFYLKFSLLRWFF